MLRFECEDKRGAVIITSISHHLGTAIKECLPRRSAQQGMLPGATSLARSLCSGQSTHFSPNNRMGTGGGSFQSSSVALGRLRQTLRVLQPGLVGEKSGPISRASAAAMSTAATGAEGGYMLPSPAIAAIVDAPPEPTLSFSPNRELIMQLARPPVNPPISELARPELKLAGSTPGWACSREGGKGYSYPSISFLNL